MSRYEDESSTGLFECSFDWIKELHRILLLSFAMDIETANFLNDSVSVIIYWPI